MKRILILCLALLLAAPIAACKNPADIINPPSASENDTLDISNCCTQKEPAAESVTNFVQFELQGGATFVIELYPEFAPKTVAHFQHLVAEGHYNGLTFHRIERDRCIYGGDVNGLGENPVTVEGEFPDNGFVQNTLKHKRGTISMDRLLSDPNSATCQFFIMQTDSTSCDGKYAAFGHVIRGMETVDAIAAVSLAADPLNHNVNKPVIPPVIERVVFVNITQTPE